MSKRDVYTCNNCGLDKEAEDLLGLLWELTTEEPKITSIDPENADRHICTACLKGLRANGFKAKGE